MQSIILIGNGKERELYISNLIMRYKIKPYRVIRYDEDSTQRLKIEDVKNIRQKLIYTMPDKEKRMVILPVLITPDSQNALLKMLEEREEDTLIILNGTSSQELLPTILSRCTLLHFNNPPSFYKKDYDASESFDIFSLYDILKAGEKTESKNDTSFIDNFIVRLRGQLLHELLHKNSNRRLKILFNTISNLSASYSYFKTNNINKRLFLEGTLLRDYQKI